ncbi:MAG: hypothetical protein IJ689_03760 [Alphaproteobacteria bacterium]|nr:hypothetical protein [Alphaproteobacteria bacterium]
MTEKSIFDMELEKLEKALESLEQKVLAKAKKIELLKLSARDSVDRIESLIKVLDGAKK